MSYLGANSQFSKYLDEYMTDAHKTVDLFMDFMNTFFSGVDAAMLDNFAGAVRLAESKCDRRRRDMESYLHASRMPAQIRTEMYLLVDRLDKVLNRLEYVANFVSLSAPDVPVILHDDIKEILLLNLKCVSHLFDAMNNLFKNPETARAQAQKVDYYETAVDSLERQAIRKIFKSDMDMGNKMMLHKFVEILCSIADRAEDVSDRIKLLAIKKEDWVGGNTITKLMSKVAMP